MTEASYRRNLITDNDVAWRGTIVMNCLLLFATDRGALFVGSPNSTAWAVSSKILQFDKALQTGMCLVAMQNETGKQAFYPLFCTSGQKFEFPVGSLHKPGLVMARKEAPIRYPFSLI